MIIEKHMREINLDEYRNNLLNAGKIIIIKFENNKILLVKEGNEDRDWFPLELEYEKLRENGAFDLLIIPKQDLTLSAFYPLE